MPFPGRRSPKRPTISRPPGGRSSERSRRRGSWWWPPDSRHQWAHGFCAWFSRRIDAVTASRSAGARSRLGRCGSRHDAWVLAAPPDLQFKPLSEWQHDGRASIVSGTVAGSSPVALPAPVVTEPAGGQSPLSSLLPLLSLLSWVPRAMALTAPPWLWCLPPTADLSLATALSAVP